MTAWLLCMQGESVARRLSTLLAACALAGTLAGAVAACGGSDDDSSDVRAVPYAKVQGVFAKYGCVSCHPGVNPSLDLTAAASYDDLVGIRALEDPRLYRVVAGDPEKSFLYLKLGGAPPIFDIPAIGTRMPPRHPRSTRRTSRSSATGSSAARRMRTARPVARRSRHPALHRPGCPIVLATQHEGHRLDHGHSDRSGSCSRSREHS